MGKDYLLDIAFTVASESPIFKANRIIPREKKPEYHA